VMLELLSSHLWSPWILVLLPILALLIAVYLKYIHHDGASGGASFIERKSYTSGSKPMTIIINPVSGSKKAPHIFSRIRAVFEQANIRMTIIETQRKGHAFRVAAQVSQQDCDGIVAIGGDGLVHEIINGLLSRSDAGIARHIPLAIIPAGSNNSFASSIGISSVEDAVERILSGHIRALDIISVSPAEGSSPAGSPPMHVVYGFQGLTWGLFSQMESLAERLRWFGRARKYLAAFILLFRSLRLPHYAVRLVFPPINSSSHLTLCTPKQCLSCEQPMLTDKGKRPDTDTKGWIVLDNNNEDLTEQDELMYIMASNVASPFTPYAHLSDGYLDIAIGTRSSASSSRMGLIQLLVQIKERDYSGQHKQFKTAHIRMEVDRKIPLILDGEVLHLPSGPDSRVVLDVAVLRAMCWVVC